MQIEYRNFKKEHIPDNEAHYFDILASIIENVDKYSYFVVIKNPDSYICRISTSNRIIDPIIQQINLFNNASHISTVFSKSMKAGNIFFKIQLF